MWWPKGYVPFLQLVNLSDILARDTLSDMSIDEKVAVFAQFAVCHWAVRRYLEHDYTSICLSSPMGDVIFVEKSIFLLTDFGEFAPTTDFGPWNASPIYLARLVVSSPDPYEFIDLSSGTVLKEFRTAQPHGFMRKFVSKFRPTSQDCRNSRLGKDYTVITGDVFKPFRGWSICFPLEGFPQDVLELRSLLTNIDRSPASPKGGRPRLTGQAALLYLSQYPEGHGNLTWAEVERKIGYTPKTIKRGLDELKAKREKPEP